MLKIPPRHLEQILLSTGRYKTDELLRVETNSGYAVEYANGSWDATIRPDHRL